MLVEFIPMVFLLDYIVEKPLYGFQLNLVNPTYNPLTLNFTTTTRRNYIEQRWQILHMP